MMKTLLTATAVSGLLFSGAFAQTTSPSTPADTPAAPSAAPPPSTTPVVPSATPTMPPVPSAASTSAPATPHFVSSQSADQWLASKFKGTDVLGPNNEKVGDVNDVVFDRSGKVLAVIVGVGGFLGIGEKDVGIDMASFQVVPGNTSSSTASGAPAGSTGAGGTTTAANDPANVKLKISMTKDELKNAPSFERYGATRTSGTGAGTNTGARPAGTAPATPVTPAAPR